MASQLGFDGGLTCAMQVTELEESIQWYQQRLGFELVYKLDDMGWCEMKTPVQKVQVGLSQVEKPEVQGGATMTWGVVDIDASRKALEDQSVRFDRDTITIEGMVKLATFFDPDGNKMMLYQDLASS